MSGKENDKLRTTLGLSSMLNGDRRMFMRLPTKVSTGFVLVSSCRRPWPTSTVRQNFDTGRGSNHYITALVFIGMSEKSF